MPGSMDCAATPCTPAAAMAISRAVKRTITRRITDLTWSGGDSFEHRVEYTQSIHRPEERLNGPLRVRHHPEDISFRAHDPRDRAESAVGVYLRGGLAMRIDIAEHDTILTLEPV